MLLFRKIPAFAELSYPDNNLTFCPNAYPAFRLPVLYYNMIINMPINFDSGYPECQAIYQSICSALRYASASFLDIITNIPLSSPD